LKFKATTSPSGKLIEGEGKWKTSQITTLWPGRRRSGALLMSDTQNKEIG
jgi:hypothetical protein